MSTIYQCKKSATKVSVNSVETLPVSSNKNGMSKVVKFTVEGSKEELTLGASKFKKSYFFVKGKRLTL